MNILYRIIDKNTMLFLRDDFVFNEATEIGFDVEPAENMFKPKWNGEGWVEGATAEEIAAFHAAVAETQANQPASLEEMFNALYGV